MIYINIAFEDELSEFVISRLLESFDNKFTICNSYNGRGFGYLRTNIRGFNEACTSIPFLVLTDLDNNNCPSYLINSWLNVPQHPNLIFRVAVREVEAWLLGDEVGFSRFSRAPIGAIPKNPEGEVDPKQTIINLVNKYSTRSMKEDIVPIGTSSIGRNYNVRLMEFVLSDWNIERAKNKCESLRRMYAKLENFQIN